MEGENQVIKFDDRRIVEAQKAAAKGNWERLEGILLEKENKDLLFKPFDFNGNTPVHAVARAGKAEILRKLLKMLNVAERNKMLRMINYHTNTLLHEVAVFLEDLNALRVIMDFEDVHQGNEQQGQKPLLVLTNERGETPVSRAAKFGNLRMLKYLHAKHPLDSELHFPPKRGDDKQRPILIACVLNFYFEVAVWLVENVDVGLARERRKDNDEDTGITCLQMLSRLRMAFKSIETKKMGITRKLIYYMLPNEGYKSESEMGDDDAGNNLFKYTLDVEQPHDETQNPPKSSFSNNVNHGFWRRLAKGLYCVREIWEQKENHKFAKRLVKLLMEHEDSWKESSPNVPSVRPSVSPNYPFNVTERKKQIDLEDRLIKEIELKMQLEKKKQDDETDMLKDDAKKDSIQFEKKKQDDKTDMLKDDVKKDSIQLEKKKQDEKTDMLKDLVKNVVIPSKTNWDTPLFMAAVLGIKEVVEMIVDEYPEAISIVNEDGYNILHLAVKHRQSEIYDFIEKSAAFASLKWRITKTDHRSILHQAASMEFYREQQLPGVAYQLQHELDWYDRVKSVVPKQYLMHIDSDDLTAGDRLDIEHAEMHAQAKQWMKETAQSCSTVAVLIAGVVFAAAYAIPGGNENGRPALKLKNSAFRIFTIMDVVALACSLGSVVMFLSILTSSFDLWDFHKSLPRKLKFGFIFLFIGLITTMLAFAATILLTIRLEGNKKTTTFTYSLAFVIVSVFGLTQFPLYKMTQDMIEACLRCWKKVSGPLKSGIDS